MRQPQTTQFHSKWCSRWDRKAVLRWLPLSDALTPALAPCFGTMHSIAMGRSHSAHPISYTQPREHAWANEQSQQFYFPVGKAPWQIWSQQFRMMQLCGSLWLFTTWRGNERVMHSFPSAERGCGSWADSSQVRARAALTQSPKKKVCNKHCYSLVAEVSPQSENIQKLQSFAGVQVSLEGIDEKHNPLLGITRETHTLSFLRLLILYG